MRIVILNWKDGENDPFTYFCEQLQRQLQALGHDVRIVPLDENVSQAMYELQRTVGLHCAITWQGIGSQLTWADSETTVWEMLDLPLLCLHGDQPAYNLINHLQTSRHLFHIYPSPTFAKDANVFIAREWPALHEILPNIFECPAPQPEISGDFFVFPKNLTDVEAIKARWRENAKPETADLLCRTADRILEAFRRDHRISHHEVIFDMLPASTQSAVRNGNTDPAIVKTVFAFKRALDPVFRNGVAGYIVDALPHVPLRVNGRGWERYAARNNPNHQFREFGNLADGEGQFWSNYGILDAAPASDMLHDRMGRAMVRGTGFLTSAAWKPGQPIYEEFQPLFFSGDPEDLAAKVEVVMADPEAHRARVRFFNDVFNSIYSLTDFMQRIQGYLHARGFVV